MASYESQLMEKEKKEEEENLRYYKTQPLRGW